MAWKWLEAFKRTNSQIEVEGLKKDIEILTKEGTRLREDNMKIKTEHEELKLKNRLEQQEIAHLQKINSEKIRMEVDQEKLKLNKDFQEQITEFRKTQDAALLKLHDELFQKLETRMNTEVGNLKEIYQALMARLPNVNWQIKHNIGQDPLEITDQGNKKRK